jgi:hypothetical protein
MAKSLLAVKGAKKIQRKSHSETYLINRKYLGDEPTKVITSVEMVRAFTWYHNMCDASDAKQYMKDYFVSDKVMIKTITRIPDARIPYTAAWMCRIATTQKRELTDFEWAKVNSDIADAAGAHEEPTEKVTQAALAKPSIQDRIKEKVANIIGDIEALLDTDAADLDLYAWLQKNEVPALHVPKIIAFYQPLHDEYYAALMGDKSIAEGYSNYTKSQLKAKVARFDKMLQDANRYAGNTKKARAPRKKKAVSTEKLLKTFKYLKESKEHKLTSVSPTSIIGAQTLWTFNPKYNILSVFHADGPAGLTVKSTAIAGFNPTTSKSIRIGRKTSERLQTVLTGGKIVLRRLMEEMELPITARLNADTILLKTVKT